MLALRNSCSAISPLVAPRGEVSNAGFLRGEVPFGVRSSLSGSFAGGAQFALGLLCVSARAHGVEHVVGGAELDAGVAASSAAAQPLAVEQVRAGEVDGRTAALKLADRLQVRGLGLAGVIKQRLAAGADPERPRRRRCAGPVGQGGERGAGHLPLVAADGGLDQLRQHPLSSEWMIVPDHRQATAHGGFICPLRRSAMATMPRPMLATARWPRAVASRI